MATQSNSMTSDHGSLRGSGEPRLTARPLREDRLMQVCLEAYGAIRREGRLADRALDLTLRKNRALHSIERRAVAERVYDAVRRQITIDHLLADVHADFAQLPPSLQDSLRLSAARVLQGDPPDRVARESKFGFRESRALAALPDSMRGLQNLPPSQRLRLLESFPEFLAVRFQAEFGLDAERAAHTMNARAPLIARVNSLKTQREELMNELREEGVASHPTPRSPLGVVLDTRINAFSLAAFKQGHFELQDEGSQLAGMLVDAPPEIVVDACAGAGGKTLQIAAQMKNRGQLFAFDIDRRRIEELRRRARRAGVHNVRAVCISTEEGGSASALAPLHGGAHRVLVDAPCSGTGILRRKPDARYRLTPELLQEHVRRQGELLRCYAELVRPQGRLIYVTCSLLREENEEVVESFLKERSDFSMRPAGEILKLAMGKDEPGHRRKAIRDEVEPGPGAGMAATTVVESMERGGFLRLTPHQHGTDGFFGAVLQRR